MKRVFLMAFIFWVMISYAQKKEKEEQMLVEYKVVTMVDMDDIKAKREIKEVIKQGFERPTYMELRLSKDESTYIILPSVSNDQPSGMMFKYNPYGNQGVWYRNLKDSIQLTEKTLDGKVYLVKDTLEKLDWKLTDEKTNRCGFEVLKANMMLKDSTEITAWYAPSITWANGPDNYYGLPGLILEVKQTKIRKGRKWERVCACVKIERVKKPKKLKKPKKGEEISQADLNEMFRIQSETMKNMFRNMSNIKSETAAE